MKRLLFGVCVAISACGCQPHAPTLSGGKPAAHWLAAANDPDARVRKAAVCKLGNIGPAEPAAFPAVARALKDRDPAVRREAILAVLKFSDRAQDAAPALQEMRLRDADPRVRDFAGKALAKLRTSG